VSSARAESSDRYGLVESSTSGQNFNVTWAKALKVVRGSGNHPVFAELHAGSGSDVEPTVFRSQQKRDRTIRHIVVQRDPSRLTCILWLKRVKEFHSFSPPNRYRSVASGSNDAANEAMYPDRSRAAAAC
jgi:hypothetical protein